MSVKPKGRYAFTAWAIQYRQSKQCVPCVDGFGMGIIPGLYENKQKADKAITDLYGGKKNAKAVRIVTVVSWKVMK